MGANDFDLFANTEPNYDSDADAQDDTRVTFTVSGPACAHLHYRWGFLPVTIKLLWGLIKLRRSVGVAYCYECNEIISKEEAEKGRA